jgi:hypothetical protein
LGDCRAPEVERLEAVEVVHVTSAEAFPSEFGKLASASMIYRTGSDCIGAARGP